MLEMGYPRFQSGLAGNDGQNIKCVWLRSSFAQSVLILISSNTSALVLASYYLNRTVFLAPCLFRDTCIRCFGKPIGNTCSSHLE